MDIPASLIQARLTNSSSPPLDVSEPTGPTGTMSSSGRMGAWEPASTDDRALELVETPSGETDSARKEIKSRAVSRVVDGQAPVVTREPAILGTMLGQGGCCLCRCTGTKGLVVMILGGDNT